MFKSFSVAAMAYLFLQELQVLLQGQWLISLQFQHSTESGKYGIPWYNIEHWIPFRQKTGISKSWTSSAFINESAIFELCSLYYFQIV